MNIILCRIGADALKLDKRADYNAAAKMPLECQLNTPVNIDNPEFIFSNSMAALYNYAFIPYWNRYYFLHDATILDGNRCIIPATCDVLTSNADDILSLYCRIKRYETDKNPDVQDSEITKTARTHTDNFRFTGGTDFIIGEGSGLTDFYHYVLSVVGGDGTQTGGNAT